MPPPDEAPPLARASLGALFYESLKILCSVLAVASF
jgi:hypothetical protein